MFQRIAVSIFILVVVAMIGLSIRFDNSAKPASPPFTILTDNKTGCDYLETAGGITPRLNPNGTQVCDRKAATEINLKQSGFNF
jgi:hypothetical protein